MVKNYLPMQETEEMWVQSLVWEDSLEEGIVTYSSILAWRIQWTEKLSRLQSTGSQRVRHDSSNLANTHMLLNRYFTKTISFKLLNGPKKKIKVLTLCK